MNKSTDKVIAQESDEGNFHSFDTVDLKIQRKLKKKKCVNCDKTLFDNEKDSYQRIDYVVLSNNDVRWWHHHYDSGTTRFT